jgi:hypothetical protein
MKIESHLKRKGTIWQSQLLGPLTPWEPNWKANIKVGPSQPNEMGKVKYPRENKYILATCKGNNDTFTSYNYDIKCFYCLSFSYVASQCLNKRVMIMKVNHKLETDGRLEMRRCHH